MKFLGSSDYHKAPSTERLDDLGDELFTESEEKDVSQFQSNITKKRMRVNQSLLVLVHLMMFGANIVFWILTVKGYRPGFLEDALVIPPLRQFLRYEVVHTDVGIGRATPYAIDTPESDEMWRNISHDGPYGWITVQKSDLEEINETSVAFTDGSGYLVGLEAFHEMHCLNYLRRKILGRSFGPNEDPMPSYHLCKCPINRLGIPNYVANNGVAHCLDILRLSLQCHADLSLMPMRWVEDYPFPWPLFQTTRQCRNWDAIVHWTQEHSTGAAGRTVHPHLGPVDGRHIDPSTVPHIGNVRYIDDVPGE